MILRWPLLVICSAIPPALLAGGNSIELSPFPQAGKRLQQLTRESVERTIAASVTGKSAKDLPAPLTFANLPRIKPVRPELPETCAIPLLESKVQHPERFSMKILKVPATPADTMAVPPPAPACQNWN
ncbi:MAG TPA: hypothetical protein VGK64_18385 [Bryobacteraceae bacterium]